MTKTVSGCLIIGQSWLDDIGSLVILIDYIWCFISMVFAFHLGKLEMKVTATCFPQNGLGGPVLMRRQQTLRLSTWRDTCVLYGQCSIKVLLLGCLLFLY